MLATIALTFTFATAPQQAPVPPRPRLVVVISIDQFRGDYVSRFSDHYLPSNLRGFNFFATKGANFIDAHYMHIPTATGPGHGVITTGSQPALNGIVGNDWFDRSAGKVMYCVDDDSVQTVGGASKPMSPRNLRVSTVGDELKMATGGKAKVVSVAFKDRAAILLAGHAADTVVWFDGGNGKWVTSTYYAPDKKLKPWVEQVNALNVPATTVGKDWTPALSDSAYAQTKLAPFVGGTVPSPVFSHRVANNSDFTRSSFGQEYVFETVKKAVVAEQLGKDEVPDMLCINLSTNDYIGHAWGPDSPEVMDISVRTDKLLNDFMAFLDTQVVDGLSRTVVVITADHGVGVIPEESRNNRLNHVVRASSGSITTAVNAALVAKYGAGNYVQYCDPPYLYINHGMIAAVGGGLRDAQRIAAEAARSVDGIFDAIAAEDVLNGQFAGTKWMTMAANSMNRKLSGDVVLFETPGTLFSGGNGASHGTPWAYDSHVPILLFGPGVKAGTFAEQVSVSDIAPTLSRLLRIEQPSGNVGKLLVRAVGD